jgi:hypothetical protein
MRSWQLPSMVGAAIHQGLILIKQLAASQALLVAIGERVGRCGASCHELYWGLRGVAAKAAKGKFLQSVATVIAFALREFALRSRCFVPVHPAKEPGGGPPASASVR